jgi:hypothetical protein
MSPTNQEIHSHRVDKRPYRQGKGRVHFRSKLQINCSYLQITLTLFRGQTTNIQRLTSILPKTAQLKVADNVTNLNRQLTPIKGLSPSRASNSHSPHNQTAPTLVAPASFRRSVKFFTYSGATLQPRNSGIQTHQSTKKHIQPHSTNFSPRRRFQSTFPSQVTATTNFDLNFSRAHKRSGSFSLLPSPPSCSFVSIRGCLPSSFPSVKIFLASVYGWPTPPFTMASI